MFHIDIFDELLNGYAHERIQKHNFFSLTLCLLVLSTDNICEQFGPAQVRLNVGADLDLKCLTLSW